MRGKGTDHGPTQVLTRCDQRRGPGDPCYEPAFSAAALRLCGEAGQARVHETPLGVDVPGVQQILAANEEAKKKNLKVVVGLYMRYARHHRAFLMPIKNTPVAKTVKACHGELL
jgi:hypothetical protein